MSEGIVIQSPMTVAGTGGPGARAWVSDDRRTAAGCAAGDHAVFEELYRQHAERMKSVAFNHLGNRAEAEEAVQETFLKIHRSAGTYNAEAPFSSWIYRVLVNTCHDITRRRARRIDESSGNAGGVEMLGSTQGGDHALRMTLRRVIGNLKPQKKSVFLLYEVEGMSHRQIAEILDIRESYSKWLLHAAKKDLQTMLQSEEVLR